MSGVTYICHMSGGITSWAAAKRLRQSLPSAEIKMLFADTFIESADTYRFLIAGAANIAGVSAPDCLSWEIPPTDFENPNPRRDALKLIAAEAMRCIPGLVWIYEGRTPWEVFNDVRFIGNSKVDPCSSILKRKLMDSWRAEHYTPATCIVCVGLNWDEDDRIVKLTTRGLPWVFIAPLGASPWVSTKECLEWAAEEGLPLSEAYLLGLAHDNCGGGCVKAGQGHWLMILKFRPLVYAMWEKIELLMMEKLGSKWSMLKCRRGGKAKPLTLKTLRERFEKNEVREEEKLELGGCACALNLEEEPEMKELTAYKKNGFSFTIYARTGNLAIFQGRKQGGSADNWEVIKIQSHNGREVHGKWVEPAEYAPSNEQWGSHGWTYTNPEDALNRFSVEIGKMPAQSLTN